jgi:hypothetical protein
LGFVCPVKRLAERNHAVRARCRPREILGEGLDPADVRDASLAGGSATFGEHCRIGVEADRVLEQVGESDGEDPGPAATVEESSGSIKVELGGQDSLELG